MQDLFSLNGKTALVTGGTRGIGLMIAEGFARRGAKVYISARHADICKDVAARLSLEGVCVGLPADLSQMAEVERLAGELKAREDGLDILVNNAGTVWGAGFDAFPESGWDKVMDLNVKALFFLSQKLAPLLQARGTADDPARIINIASIDGLHVSEIETYSYAASKAGVIHLTKMMARNLAARHITVNAIAPGLFPSKMTAETIDKAGDRIIAATPLRRFGRAEDMAGAAIYLASRAGGFVTGAVIPVDGGFATTL